MTIISQELIILKTKQKYTVIKKNSYFENKRLNQMINTKLKINIEFSYLELFAHNSTQKIKYYFALQ